MPIDSLMHSSVHLICMIAKKIQILNSLVYSVYLHTVYTVRQGSPLEFCKGPKIWPVTFAKGQCTCSVFKIMRN